MNTIRFQLGLDPRVQAIAAGLIEHTLRSCAPETLLDNASIQIPHRPTHILAFGKASIGMARWFADALADRLVGGVVLAPEELIVPIHPRVITLAADHPHPTQRNIEAAARLRVYAESIPAGDACIVCISGGGSAHLCSPRPGVTLEQIIETTRSFNESGATIQELNAIRKQFETLKAGGLGDLLAHCPDTRVYLISDVIGDDLGTIASGPMMTESHPPLHLILGNHTTPAAALRAQLGTDTIVQTGITGDAQIQGKALAESFLRTGTTTIYAGETTVDVHDSGGIGGPCMEASLACALALAQANETSWMVLGLATDGIDGPSDACGSIIAPAMITASPARHALQNHDTLAYLDSIGATIRTGPTGTNVNDLVLVLKDSEQS